MSIRVGDYGEIKISTVRPDNNVAPINLLPIAVKILFMSKSVIVRRLQHDAAIYLQ